MNIASTLKTVRSVITANSPVLLVGTAIAGVITTGVLAAKGGYKARGILEEEDAMDAPLARQAQLTWLCYVAPAVTGVTTIASVVGVHTIHTKRHAALAGLYAITSTKLDDYSEKAEELLGAKKTQDLHNVLSQRAVDQDPVENHEIIMTGNGKELCYDEWSGRYFDGSVAVIERAVNEVNRMILEGTDVSLDDFYEYLGLPPTEMGSVMGWSGGQVRVSIGSTVATDGRSAIAFTFQTSPRTGYGNVH